MSKRPDVQIGDVFYRLEPTDFKHYHRKCRVCEGKKELVINGVLFNCPVCQKEQEVLRVNGFEVRRYRVCAITEYTDSSDWKPCEWRARKYKLYHKSGRGYSSYCSDHRTIELSEDYFTQDWKFNNPEVSEYFNSDARIYSDYKLAVAVADKLTQMQVEMVRAYNEANNTDYELPVFKIEHDKKSN